MFPYGNPGEVIDEVAADVEPENGREEDGGQDRAGGAERGHQLQEEQDAAGDEEIGLGGRAEGTRRGGGLDPAAQDEHGGNVLEDEGHEDRRAPPAALGAKPEGDAQEKEHPADGIQVGEARRVAPEHDVAADVERQDDLPGILEKERKDVSGMRHLSADVAGEEIRGVPGDDPAERKGDQEGREREEAEVSPPDAQARSPKAEERQRHDGCQDERRGVSVEPESGDRRRKDQVAALLLLDEADEEPERGRREERDDDLAVAEAAEDQQPRGDARDEERQQGEQTAAKAPGHRERGGEDAQADEDGRELHPEVARSRHRDHGHDEVVVERPRAELEVEWPLAEPDEVEVLADDDDVPVDLGLQGPQAGQAEEDDRRDRHEEGEAVRPEREGEDVAAGPAPAFAGGPVDEDAPRTGLGAVKSEEGLIDCRESVPCSSRRILTAVSSPGSCLYARPEPLGGFSPSPRRPRVVGEWRSAAIRDRGDTGPLRENHEIDLPPPVPDGRRSLRSRRELWEGREAGPGDRPPRSRRDAAPANPAVTVSIAGVPTEVTFPRLDIGQIQDLFDGKRESMARTENANTAVIDLAFQGAREARGLEVITGTMDVGVEVTLTLADKPEPLVFSTKLVQQTTEPTVRVDFGGVQKFTRARVQIANLNGGDGHIHIYEMAFK